MKNNFFARLEVMPEGSSLPVAAVIDQLVFNEQGLIPVIAQDANSKQVLMFAWMNRESLLLTLESGQMTYWSRSRQGLWKKGATSGHTQRLRSFALDCDGDALLCEVEQVGGACHTGRPSCFYLKLNQQRTAIEVIGDYSA